MRNYWCRLSTDFWCSPKVLRLRKVCARDVPRNAAEVTAELRWRRALAVYQTLLGVHSETDGDGVLRDHWLDDDYLSKRSSVDVVELSVALEDLERGAFIKRKANELSLVGWSDEWRSAMSSTARSRAYRRRQREEKGS